MPATVIPCKRPKVPVVDGPEVSATYCLVPGCEWKYGPGVKTDVNEQATRHRGQHREAVPGSVLQKHADGGYEVAISCGFYRHDGTTTTRSDAEAVIQHHLSHDHGLVTC